MVAAKAVHRSAWELARLQHWVIRGDQLRALGYSRAAIRHRVGRGRLHLCWPDTYAVGRPQLSPEGLWLAAVFTCGPGAVLSHRSAAELWGVLPPRRGSIDVSVPYARRAPRREGIRVRRRRRELPGTQHRRIPVTVPAQTLLDVACDLSESQLERAINEADKLDLVHPGGLRGAAEAEPGAGPKRIRDLLDRHTFVLTDSELERLFLPLARRAGLSRPRTQARVNGFDVDFYFAEHDLVVETDGGRFHRTPAQQTRDRQREHAHLVAGLTPVRFTHAQVMFEPDYVVRTLAAVA